MDAHIVHRNGPDGTQVEWNGVMLTLRPTDINGLHGSLAMKDEKGKVVLLEFHSGQQHEALPFPLTFHVVKL